MNFSFDETLWKTPFPQNEGPQTLLASSCPSFLFFLMFILFLSCLPANIVSWLVCFLLLGEMNAVTSTDEYPTGKEGELIISIVM